MNSGLNIFFRNLSRSLPKILKSRTKIENGVKIQKPNIFYTIMFIILSGLALFLSLFILMGVMASISRGEIQYILFIFLGIVLALILFLIYFYKYFIKSYIIDSEYSIIKGDIKNEKLILFKDIDKIVDDQSFYKIYHNNDVTAINYNVFTPENLTRYIIDNFKLDKKGLLKNTFIRKTELKQNKTGFYKEVNQNDKHYELVKSINRDLEPILSLGYEEQLEYMLNYLPAMMDNPEFADYFSNYYNTTIRELNEIKLSKAKYISYTRLIIDNNIDNNNLTKILFNIASEYRKKQ